MRKVAALLRLDLIADAALRETAAETLARRRIFTPRALALTAQAEAAGGLTGPEADEFIAEVLETTEARAESWITEAEAFLSARIEDAGIVRQAGLRLTLRRTPG